MNRAQVFIYRIERDLQLLREYRKRRRRGLGFIAQLLLMAILTHIFLSTIPITVIIVTLTLIVAIPTLENTIKAIRTIKELEENLETIGFNKYVRFVEALSTTVEEECSNKTNLGLLLYSGYCLAIRHKLYEKALIKALVTVCCIIHYPNCKYSNVRRKCENKSAQIVKNIAMSGIKLEPSDELKRAIDRWTEKIWGVRVVSDGILKFD